MASRDTSRDRRPPPPIDEGWELVFTQDEDSTGGSMYVLHHGSTVFPPNYYTSGPWAIESEEAAVRKAQVVKERAIAKWHEHLRQEADIRRRTTRRTI